MSRGRRAGLAFGAPLRTTIALQTRFSRRRPLSLRWRLRRRIRPAAAAAGARIDVFHRWLTNFSIHWHSSSYHLRQVDRAFMTLARIGRRSSAAMPVGLGGARVEYRRIDRGPAPNTAPPGMPKLRDHIFTRHFHRRFTQRELERSRFQIERHRTHERHLSERSDSVLMSQTAFLTVHRHQFSGSATTNLTTLAALRPDAATRRSDVRPVRKVERTIHRPAVQIWRTGQASPETATATFASPLPSQPVPAGQATEWRSAAITQQSVECPPDMNRLIDEVLRRIERQARSERTRRGI